MSGRGGSLTNAVAVARPVLQDVDVQVLGMRRIGPWAEYRCEPPACGDADGIDRATQMFIPIRFDGQCFAIRELEACDVHRQTGRVRTDLAGLCAVAIAAFVTRSRVNRLEFDRELAGNERSGEIAQPMTEPFTELTGISGRRIDVLHRGGNLTALSRTGVSIAHPGLAAGGR